MHAQYPDLFGNKTNLPDAATFGRFIISSGCTVSSTLRNRGKPVEKRRPVLPHFYRIINIFFVETKARGPFRDLRASNLQI
jgi:hypothetical protein